MFWKEDTVKERNKKIKPHIYEERLIFKKIWMGVSVRNAWRPI